MKKLLLGIIAFLLVVLIGFTMVQGIKIGNFKIYGIKDLKQNSDNLQGKVEEATKLASSDYQERIDSLNDEMDKLKNSKTNYEDMVSVSTDSEVEAANQSYENMIGFLLVRIENHAKSEGVTIDLVVATSSSGAENVYDLRFTARGSYVGKDGSEFKSTPYSNGRGYKYDYYKRRRYKIS